MSPLSNSRNDVKVTPSVPWFRLTCNEYLPCNVTLTGNILGTPHSVLWTPLWGRSGYTLYIRRLRIREVNWHSRHQACKLWGWDGNSGLLTPNQCPLVSQPHPGQTSQPFLVVRQWDIIRVTHKIRVIWKVNPFKCYEIICARKFLDQLIEIMMIFESLLLTGNRLRPFSKFQSCYGATKSMQ